MSLTSYRAAPPRDKPLRAFAKNRCRNGFGPRPKAPIDPVRRLPEKATRANAHGARRMYQCEGALERPVSDLFGVLSGRNRLYQVKPARKAALARMSAKAQPLGQ